MNSTQFQGLIVAVFLISLLLGAAAIAIKVMPNPADEIQFMSDAERKKRNNRALAYVSLALVGIAAGHMLAFYMLGA